MTEDIKPSTLAGGFNLIARDFDRAVRLARLDPLQAFLLAEARERSWTPGLKQGGSREPEAFSFNFSELARLLECNRAWLSNQSAGLVQLRILKESPGGALLINKDYREWLRRERTPDGERLVNRFTDKQLSWIIDVTAKGRNCTAHHTVNGVRRTVQAGTVHRTARYSPPYSAVQSTVHPPSSPPDPLQENARVGETKKTLETSREKVCQTQPTYSKPGAGESVGESVGGSVGESIPSTETTPIPPGLVAVADRSAAIPALYAVSFSPRLRTAWLTDGRLQAWWQEYPDSPAWSEALNDLAGVDAEKRHVGMYLSIVKRLARRAAIPAAGPARRPSRNDLANDALRELKARRGMEARRDRG
jgi:hypothetical protein